MSYREIPQELIRKYDIPGPRYTSYPTVPAWSGKVDQETWLRSVGDRLEADKNSLSLYMHILYCESLCTYCGCNVKITKDHSLGNPLIDAIHSELGIYRSVVGTPILKELHLGGGTPTFLSPQELARLLDPVLDQWTKRTAGQVLAIEVDPRVTTLGHLDYLRDAGFNRISLGVQDFDPQVMKAVHREQPFELVEYIVTNLRSRGMSHINFDLLYGLPYQTPKTMSDTMDKVLRLRPSRIAFYSYAHVPWVRPAQKILENDPLPLGPSKRALYELGRARLEDAGYVEIGMDHFALPDDDLSQARKTGQLHRNFQGYTVQKSRLLLGLGPSSISDSWTCFAQNEKNMDSYKDSVMSGKLAHTTGHKLSSEDLKRRELILNLMCRMEAEWDQDDEALSRFQDDGLLERQGSKIQVTPLGRVFIRNICMTFDQYLQETLQKNQKLYSRTV